MQKLYTILNYTFKQPQLLKEALTHASKAAGYSYERLEYLGDAVLQLVVSTMLYRKYPDYAEGQLTVARTQLVREAFLADWARAKGLPAFLILGKGEEHNNGRNKSSILCDVTESVIGAVYLDGGLKAAAQLIRDIVVFCDQARLQERDAKSELQELLQQKPGQEITYRITGAEGPAHDTTFFAEVLVNGLVAGSGIGKSKKTAEHAAAQQALLKYNK